MAFGKRPLISVLTILMTTLAALGQEFAFQVHVVKDRTAHEFIDIGFSAALIEQFLCCLSQATTVNCSAQYGPQNALLIHPVQNVTQNGDQTKAGASIKYYNCRNSHSTFKCHREDHAPDFSEGNNIISYPFLITNSSSCRSSCVSLILSHDDESITFQDGQFNFKFCGQKCDCPSAMTATEMKEISTAGGATRAPKDEDEDDVPVGVIIGVVIAVAVIAIGLSAFVVVLCRRKRRATYNARRYAQAALRSTNKNTGVRSRNVYAISTISTSSNAGSQIREQTGRNHDYEELSFEPNYTKYHSGVVNAGFLGDEETTKNTSTAAENDFSDDKKLFPQRKTNRAGQNGLSSKNVGFYNKDETKMTDDLDTHVKFTHTKVNTENTGRNVSDNNFSLTNTKENTSDHENATFPDEDSTAVEKNDHDDSDISDNVVLRGNIDTCHGTDSPKNTVQNGDFGYQDQVHPYESMEIKRATF